MVLAELGINVIDSRNASSTHPLTILHIAAEHTDFARTGGLGEAVSGKQILALFITLSMVYIVQSEPAPRKETEMTVTPFREDTCRA